MEHAPELVEGVLADARPGAPWRRDLDLPEPSDPLATALTAVCDAVAAAGGTDDAVLTVLGDAPPVGDAPVALATAVLRTALESRRDQRAVRSPRR